MPGRNILGVCSAWTDGFPLINSISISYTSSFACEHKEGEEPDPEEVFTVSGSADGEISFSRVSGKGRGPNAVPPGPLEFIAGSTGCCCPVPVIICADKAFPDLSDNGEGHATCLYTIDEETIFENIQTGPVDVSLVFFGRCINGAQEVLIDVAACGEFSLSTCLGFCRYPCVSEQSDWMPVSALLGAHVFSVSESDDGSDPDNTFTFNATITVSIG